MIYFVEFWNAKDTWKSLPESERANYMGQIGPHIQNLLNKGVQLITWSENDPLTTQRADYDYFAIWSFPNQQIADSFQELVENAGWYNYFQQANVMGTVDTAESIIGKLVKL